eukprot:6604272-Karenia_brevis.AAC.1
MVMDPPPSPIREDGESEDLGAPWPGMADGSFDLILPGKGNPKGGKGSGEPQYVPNMVAELNRTDEDL